MANKKLDDALSAIREIVDTATLRADESFPKIEKVIEIKPHAIKNIRVSTAFDVKVGYFSGSTSKPTTHAQVDSKLEEYKKLYDSECQRIQSEHESNLPAIENNKKVRERVSFIMGQLGIPAVYKKSYYKTNRSSKMTHESVTSGWSSDLTRCCPVFDGYESLLSAARSHYEEIVRQSVVEKNRITSDQRKKMEEEKEKDSVKLLSFMCGKYGIENGDWDDVVIALDNKCKYFALARALEDNRNNWSCGFDRAVDAILSFEVDHTTSSLEYSDIKIKESLCELIDGELDDGRVFRDTEFGYGFLYTLANPDVREDYSKISEYLDQ